MTEDQKIKETIAFMVDSVNLDNQEICERKGMSPEEIEAALEQSQPNLNVLMSNLYFRMKNNNVIS